MNVKALVNTLTTKCRTLPIVIFYVTEGCNLKCRTCSYRHPLPNELSFSEIANLAHTLNKFGLKHIVYSGGEPLVRRDFPLICEIFGRFTVKQTLLTNGMLLEKQFAKIQEHFSEIIVSIDGPNEITHNAIRGVDSFTHIVKGIQRAIDSPRRPRISIRTVLQKRNFDQLITMVEFAMSLRVDRISFLSADVLSSAFGRDTRGTVARDTCIILTEEETIDFRHNVEQLVSQYSSEFKSGFISQSPERMFHIVQYFEALIGKAPFPQNYCNAPMISAVITSTGNILPCFFLPSFGNIRRTSLNDLLNNSPIRSIRQDVRDYTLERCQKCVCTLHVEPLEALLDRF